MNRIVKIEKHSCFGDTLNIKYEDGTVKALAFFNETHRNRAYEIMMELIKQINITVETE